MKIVNQSRVNLEYQYDPTMPVVRETQVSNLAITYVLDDRLCVRMSAVRSLFTFFETFEYNIKIRNICGIKIVHIRIQDSLPKSLYYIQNSIIINGIRRRCCTPYEGIPIEFIDVGEEVSILFRVVIPVQSAPRQIVNRCMVSYDYQYDYQLPMIEKVIESNWVKSWIHNIYYKMSSVSANIVVNNQFMILRLNHIELSPLQRKTVRGKYESSIVIVDCMECYFELRRKGSQRSCPMKAQQGIACTMKVPDGVRYCNVGRIQGKIEDIQVNQISCKVWNISLQICYYFVAE